MLLFRAQSIKADCCVFKTGSKFVPSICNSNEIGECISNDSKNRHQADLLVSWCNLTAIQNDQYNFERKVMKGGGAEGGAPYNYSAGWWLQMEKKIPFLFVKRAH